ncbi:hypothetical protein ACJ77P_14145 [Syntrophus buswellii]|uniref:hypothetical protein n=1 Tax=Syntrophus buswellii TaxID=43774 RepID=UPI0038D481A1
MKPHKLLLLDYSGTLSLQAVLFGRGDSLQSALEQSGLACLGITPSRLWEKIVNPTWEEGSTTPVGYRQILLRHLLEDAGGEVSSARPGFVPDLERAAEAFVDFYLAASRMEDPWRPLLRKLADQPGLRTVIVTDHYAEATATILRYLADWEIPAVSAKEVFGPEPPAALIVANSADLGVHKDTPCFWQSLKSGLGLHALKDILLIDDFGLNEHSSDAYGDRTRVERRQEETARLLREIFSVEARIFRFFLERGEGLPDYERLMRRVERLVNQFLEGTG